MHAQHRAFDEFCLERHQRRHAKLQKSHTIRGDHLEDALEADAKIVLLVVAGCNREEVAVFEEVLVLGCVGDVDWSWWRNKNKFYIRKNLRGRFCRFLKKMKVPLKFYGVCT